MLPESSFNIEAANFVPAGFVIPAGIKVTTSIEKEKAIDKPSFKLNVPEFIPSNDTLVAQSKEPERNVSES